MNLEEIKGGMRMYRQEIEKYMEEHKQEMLQDIIRLCRIDSQRGEAKEGMPFGEGPYKALMDCIDMVEGYGFSVKNYDNYAMAVDLNDKEKQLDIWAHLDVVPEGEGWSECEPFAPVMKGDKIFGRGTSDDKGPAVAALYALRCIKELNIPLNKNARVILGTDEECGSGCLKHYYTIEKEAPMTFSPDGEYPVVNIEKGRLPGHFTAEFEEEVGEKVLLSIEAGTKINVVPPKAKAVISGFTSLELEKVAKELTEKIGIRYTFKGENPIEIMAYGENAHASLPAHGNNAITGLLALLVKLDFTKSKKIEVIRNLYHLIPHGDLSGEALGLKMEDKKSGALTLVLSMLSLKENQLEGYFDSRCPICAVPEQVLSICRETFAKNGMTFHNTDMTPPHEVPEDSHFVQTLLRIYEEYTGLKGHCIALGGGTYVHDLANGVAFGAVLPGTDTRMHGADEFAVIEELVVTAKMIAQSIVDLCQ